MERIAATYPDVFQGLGCMEGALHFTVDESALPSIMPPRRVPLALKKRLKEELIRLEKASVIKKEEEPTDWVSSLVVTEKPNGKLRVCIDPQHLNKALKRSYYPLPVIEDILPELADVRVFSKADLKDGFLHIQLDQRPPGAGIDICGWPSESPLLQNVFNESWIKILKVLKASSR